MTTVSALQDTADRRLGSCSGKVWERVTLPGNGGQGSGYVPVPDVSLIPWLHVPPDVPAVWATGAMSLAHTRCDLSRRCLLEKHWFKVRINMPKVNLIETLPSSENCIKCWEASFELIT